MASDSHSIRFRIWFHDPTDPDYFHEDLDEYGEPIRVASYYQVGTELPVSADASLDPSSLAERLARHLSHAATLGDTVEPGTYYMDADYYRHVGQAGPYRVEDQVHSGIVVKNPDGKLDW